MSKLAQYLGQNLSGEVSEDNATRSYLARDGSVIKIKPQVAVFPRTTDDIRKTARFAWRLMEKGMSLPITARGYGSDTTGATIGSGVSMVFPAHMSKVLELDTKIKKIRAQSGINMRTLQEVLATHGLHLPVFPINLKNATLGGAIGNNVAGPKTAKFGDMRNYVEQLQVVLSNGELVETGRLSKRDLSAKKGLATLEGEIYRELDALITENHDTIMSTASDRPDNTGYHLWSVKGADGSFDLTPLLIGSQGTLAITSQAIMRTEDKPLETALMMVVLKNFNNFTDIVTAIAASEPSEFEFIDGGVIRWVRRQMGFNPLNTLKIDDPAGVLVIEFDDGEGLRSRSARKVFRMLEEIGAIVQVAETADDKEDILALRFVLDHVVNYHKENLRSVSFDGASVPLDKIAKFYNFTQNLVTRRKAQGFVTGRIGAGNLTVTILADTSRIGHRQAIFNLGNDLYSGALKLGGSIVGDSGDGRLRQAAGLRVYGDQMLGIYEKVKQIFDPKNILNPGVVIGTDPDDLIGMLDTNRPLRFVENRPRQ